MIARRCCWCADEVGCSENGQFLFDDSAKLVAAVRFAGCAIAFNNEIKHFLALGTTRTGKSTAIRQLLGDAARWRDRAIIADPDGAISPLLRPKLTSNDALAAVRRQFWAADALYILPSECVQAHSQARVLRGAMRKVELRSSYSKTRAWEAPSSSHCWRSWRRGPFGVATVTLFARHKLRKNSARLQGGYVGPQDCRLKLKQIIGAH